MAATRTQAIARIRRNIDALITRLGTCQVDEVPTVEAELHKEREQLAQLYKEQLYGRGRRRL